MTIVDCRNQTTTIEEIMARQDKERGFTVTQVDKEKLLERINWKDWSAYFLGKTFCTMYRSGISANLDLTKVCNLDAKGKNLLFKIIFARDVENWRDQYLYELEQEICEILGLDYVDGMVVEIGAENETD
jgi:hypothetical protein